MTQGMHCNKQVCFTSIYTLLLEGIVKSVMKYVNLDNSSCT